MKEINKIKVFENKKIRTVWNEEEEDWYFSVVDVVEALLPLSQADLIVENTTTVDMRIEKNGESQLNDTIIAPVANIV